MNSVLSIKVLVSQAVCLVLRDNFPITYMVFACNKVIYPVIYTINWNITLLVYPVNPFNRFNELISLSTSILIVILLTNMNNEARLLRIGTHSETLDIVHIDLSLNCRHIFDIVQVLVGQQKHPVLVHTKLVLLGNDAAEQDALALLCADLQHYFGVTFAVGMI